MKQKPEIHNVWGIPVDSYLAEQLDMLMRYFVIEDIDPDIRDYRAYWVDGSSFARKNGFVFIEMPFYHFWHKFYNSHYFSLSNFNDVFKIPFQKISSQYFWSLYFVEKYKTGNVEGVKQKNEMLNVSQLAFNFSVADTDYCNVDGLCDGSCRNIENFIDNETGQLTSKEVNYELLD